MIEKIVDYLKSEKKSISVYEIQKKFDLTAGQLNLIILQLLKIGYITEESYPRKDDETDFITCQDCPLFYKCSKNSSENIKIYKLTQKALNNPMEKDSY